MAQGCPLSSIHYTCFIENKIVYISEMIVYNTRSSLAIFHAYKSYVKAILFTPQGIKCTFHSLWTDEYNVIGK